MIKTQLLSPVEPLWTEFLDGVEHDIYHLPRYAEIEAERLEGEPRAVYVADGDRALLLPLILRPLPGDLDGGDAISPYGYPGPLLSAAGHEDQAFIASAGKAVAAALGEARCCSAFIRAHPFLPQPAALFADSGVRREIGPTVCVDLAVSREDRLAAMNPKTRWTVRRTLRDDFTVHVDEDWSALGAFEAIYTETMDRVAASNAYYFDFSYFEALREALADQIHLMIVLHDEEVVGAGLFTEACGIVQYHLSGAKRMKGRSPTAVMLDYTAAWAESRGNRMLHLGGGVGGLADNLFNFKARFSAARGSFFVWHMITDRELFDLACATLSGRDPDEETASDGFFPPYRRT